MQGRGAVTYFLRKSLFEAQSGVPSKNEIRQYFRWHYEGEWQDGSRTGKGIHSTENGYVIKGSFLNNKPHGEGTFICDKEKYEGEWYQG